MAMTSPQETVYCDTDTLLNNVARHKDAKSRQELEALSSLLAMGWSGQVIMLRSRVALREITNTTNPDQMERLLADYDALAPIVLDERVYGFHNQWDRSGGITYPLISDVQDEGLRDELIAQGIRKKDAEHIAQAATNHCTVFLTRDEAIISKRQWLGKRLPALKIRRPSELLTELGNVS